MLAFVGLPTSLFANIIIAFVTLRNGSRFGLVTLLWVALPALAMLALGHISIFDLIWVRCLIIYGLALVLTHTHRWNDVLAALTILGVIVVAVIHGIIPDIDQKWYELANQFMKQWTAAGQTQPSQWQDLIHIFAHIGTGLAIGSILIILLLQLLIARFWQAIMFNPGALRKEVFQIRINRWVSLLLPLAIILMMVTQAALLIDLLPIILFPFVVAGFVVLHTLAFVMPKLKLLIPIAYIITCLFIYLVCLWACLGFIDAWVSFPFRRQALQLLKKGEK